MTPRRDPVFRERAHAMVEAGLITRDQCCDHKRAYVSRNDARHAAKAVSKKTGRMATTYKCEFCGLYHVTKFKHGEESAA